MRTPPKASGMAHRASLEQEERNYDLDITHLAVTLETHNQSISQLKLKQLLSQLKHKDLFGRKSSS